MVPSLQPWSLQFCANSCRRNGMASSPKISALRARSSQQQYISWTKKTAAPSGYNDNFDLCSPQCQHTKRVRQQSLQVLLSRRALASGFDRSLTHALCDSGRQFTRTRPRASAKITLPAQFHCSRDLQS